jgi:hypothetical protein
VRERAPDFLLWAIGIFDDELRRAERRVEAAALRGEEAAALQGEVS